MEKMLVLCGIWIVLISCQRWNIIWKNKEKKPILPFISGMIGVGTIIVGLFAVLDWMKPFQKAAEIIYIFMFLLSIIYIFIKIKKEKGMLSKSIAFLGIILSVISIIIVCLNVKEVASACVILTGELIMLAVQYEHIEIGGKKK